MDYSDYIVKQVRMWLGLEANDDSKDDEIAKMSRKQVFDAVLEWNGFINYSYKIIEWVQDIFDVILEDGDD